MERQIITEAPVRRSKGFKNFRFKTAPVNDREVSEFVAASLAGTTDPRLSENDYALLRKIARSYDELLDGGVLGHEDFVLKGHEMLEYKLVSPSQRLRYLVYRYKYNKYPELKILDEFPPCLQIEPTSVCNFRCVMCYQSDRSFSRKSHGYMGNMDYHLFTRVIDEVAGNIEAITFASRGEPLLHRDITRMLEYCHGKFLALKLNTNASLLDEQMIHALLSSDLQTLVFSIDAADAELYETIRVGGDFEKIVRNLDLFSNIRERQYPDSKTIVRISGVKLNDQQDIDELDSFWQQFADVVSFTNYNPWETTYDNKQNEIKIPCTELWRRMFVWWDGKVNPCDSDFKSTLSRWKFGDLPLSEIWNSSHYNELRVAHLSGDRSKVAPCDRCIVI